MEGFLNAASAVLVLLLLMLVGYLMSWAGWMGPHEKIFLNKFIFNVAIPCNVINGVLNKLEKSMLGEMMDLVLLGAVLMTVTLLLSAGLAVLLRLPRNRFGVFVAMGGLSNALFVGLPMGLEIFGEVCTPYVMVYYLVNSVFIQTVALALIQWSGEQKGEKRGALTFFRQLFSKPPVITIFISLALLILELRPPEVLMSVAGYISSSVAPLALIYTGYVVYELGLKNLRLERGLPTMLVMRLAIAPAICMVLSSAMGISGLGRSVFAMESGLPVISQAAVLAGKFGAGDHYAAVGATLSTIGCFVSMPILMLCLG